MRRISARHEEPHPTRQPDDLLLELDDFDPDESDGVAALAVHNEQLHRYLREL